MSAAVVDISTWPQAKTTPIYRIVAFELLVRAKRRVFVANVLGSVFCFFLVFRLLNFERDFSQTRIATYLRVSHVLMSVCAVLLFIRLVRVVTSRFVAGLTDTTPCPEKDATTFLPLTLPVPDRFSKFFHRQT